MWLDAEISKGWCIGMSFRCTPYESLGIGSVILYYITIIIGTIVHRCLQDRSPSAQQARHNSATKIEDWVIACCICAYFFCIVIGCLLWALVGLHAVHPYQQMWVQLFGSIIVLACTVLFVVVHITMGDNWTPASENCRTRKLVTHGVFRCCRHPMYAGFLWATVGSFTATLNWMITLCVVPPCMTLFCIKTEERTLTELFGSEYQEYRRRVSALGLPWCCFGFGREVESDEINNSNENDNKDNATEIVDNNESTPLLD